MARYIIADLHLSHSRPDLLEAFKCFVKSLTSNDTLIILGDLFEFYIGIDKKDLAQQVVKDTIRKAKTQGTNTLFIRGNRDFLINSKDAEYFGMKLLPDLYVIQLGSGPTLLMHGDLLCTNDIQYQKFRKIVHNKVLQKLFLLLPISIRRKIAKQIRITSESNHNFPLDPKIYGVVPATIKAYLHHAKCVNIIHGHIHAFGRYIKEVPGENARISLGSWNNYFSFVRGDLNGTAAIEKPIDLLIRSKNIHER